MEEVMGRLEMGKRKYGHGVVVNHDTTTWGTKENSWMEMAREEFLDAVVYITADYIRKNRMSQMEINYINSCKNTIEQKDDDNELIKYILNNWNEEMKPCRHKTLLCTLFNILKYP